MNDAFYLNEHNLPCIIRGNVKIEWVNLGEGLNGDYDPEDSNDANLLRFDVHRMENNDWQSVQDGSYCTMIDVRAPYTVLQEYLIEFMDKIHNDISVHGKSELMEELSWTGCNE